MTPADRPAGPVSEPAADTPVAATRRDHRQVARAASAMATRLLAALGFFVSSSLLTRRLDPADFGVVNIVISVATAGSFIAAAGLNRVLLRDVAAAIARGRTERVRADVTGARRLLTVSIPLGAVLATILAVLILDSTGWALLVAATLITAALGIVLVASDLLRGLGEVMVADLTAGRSGGVLALFGFSALLVLWPGSHSVDGALVAYLLALALAVAVTLWRIRGTLHTLPDPAGAAPAPEARPRGSDIVSLTAVAWPFAATQLALFLAGQVDLWVAGSRLGEADAGLYGAALRLMTVVALPLQAVQLTMIARIAGLHATDRTVEMQRQVQRAALLAAIPAIAVLIPCIVAPSTLLEVAFGAPYGEAAVPLQALALSQLVNVLSGLCGAVLAMSGNERTLLAVTVAGAAATAAASWAGAGAAGLSGLAIGSAASTAAMYTALWLLARVRAGVWTHPWLDRVRPH